MDKLYFCNRCDREIVDPRIGSGGCVSQCPHCNWVGVLREESCSTYIHECRSCGSTLLQKVYPTGVWSGFSEREMAQYHCASCGWKGTPRKKDSPPPPEALRCNSCGGPHVLKKVEFRGGIYSGVFCVPEPDNGEWQCRDCGWAGIPSTPQPASGTLRSVMIKDHDNFKAFSWSGEPQSTLVSGYIGSGQIGPAYLFPVPQEFSFHVASGGLSLSCPIGAPVGQVLPSNGPTGQCSACTLKLDGPAERHRYEFTYFDRSKVWAGLLCDDCFKTIRRYLDGEV